MEPGIRARANVCYCVFFLWLWDILRLEDTGIFPSIPEISGYPRKGSGGTRDPSRVGGRKGGR